VIVDNLDLPGVAITPDEADTPLLVDANAMLPKSVATKGFQPVAGRDPQIIWAALRRAWSADTTPCRPIAIRLDLTPARVWTRYILLPDG